MNGKVLDVNVTRTVDRDTIVDHVDSQHMIFAEQSGTILRVSEFTDDSAEKFCVFCSNNRS